MKTLDFLDKINGAIAEQFAPIIGKPNYEFGGVHNFIADLVASLIKEEGLIYSTWFLRPIDREELYLYDVELFKLNCDGFVDYKGRKYRRVGRWERAPRYEVMAAVMAPTVEEIISRGICQKIEQSIHQAKVERQNYANKVGEMSDFIAERTALLEQYKPTQK